jgi:hypothetical protein
LHFAAARFRGDGVSPRPPDEAVIRAHENGPTFVKFAMRR